jgi:hypothetical protein
MTLRSNGDRRQRQFPVDVERRDPPAAGTDEGIELGSIPLGLIEESVVDATCISVQKVPYARFGHTRWVFTFAIAFPEQYSNQNIEMFIRDYGRQIRNGSKLFHAVQMASGELKRNQKITTALFVGKMFRLKTRIAVSKDGQPYTIADSIIEKLTG